MTERLAVHRPSLAGSVSPGSYDDKSEFQHSLTVKET